MKKIVVTEILILEVIKLILVEKTWILKGNGAANPFSQTLSKKDKIV